MVFEMSMACTPESLPVDVDGVGYRVTVTAPSLGRLLYSSELSAAAAWKRFTVDFGGDDPAGATVPLLFTVDFVGLSGEAAAPTAGALVTIDQLASGSWASLPVDVGGAKLGLAGLDGSGEAGGPPAAASRGGNDVADRGGHGRGSRLLY